MYYIGNGGVEVVCRLEKEKEANRDIQKGITLADNLKLRLASQQDVNGLSHFPNTPNSLMPYCLNRYVLDCSFDIPDDPEISTRTWKEIITKINNAITALRLLKRGYVDSNCILTVTSKTTGKQFGMRAERSIPNSELIEAYHLRTDELGTLRELIERISKIDFDNAKQLNVALRRFENAYYNTENEDKLIDYMIAFEALFTTIKERTKGRNIAKKCSNLIGNDEADKGQISNLLQQAYNKRNRIVHGEDLTITDEPDLDDENIFFLGDFVIEIEELLRRTIKIMIERL
jgi:hypothetical protein